MGESSGGVVIVGCRSSCDGAFEGQEMMIILKLDGRKQTFCEVRTTFEPSEEKGLGCLAL